MFVPRGVPRGSFLLDTTNFLGVEPRFIFDGPDDHEKKRLRHVQTSTFVCLWERAVSGLSPNKPSTSGSRSSACVPTRRQMRKG